MQNQTVLISDDTDFFEYIIPKLKFRQSDELTVLRFDELPKLFSLPPSAVIINGEGAESKTLDLLQCIKYPAIVFGYNTDKGFELEVCKNGALWYITPLISDEELRAKIFRAMRYASELRQNNFYREILSDAGIISPHREVFRDFNSILDKELKKINKTGEQAVCAAISPDNGTKFLIKPDQIETIILANIRKNDILMNYAENKYFILLHNSDINSAQKLWDKISEKIPQKIYAGFANTCSKTRTQVVNESLNRLHEAVCNAKSQKNSVISAGNFKLFRQEFKKKTENIINPAFYHARQKYNDRFLGAKIGLESGDGFSAFTISGRNRTNTLKITCPGLSKINIDICSEGDTAKRITLEPDELEAGFLEDLLEQFVNEFTEDKNDFT